MAYKCSGEESRKKGILLVEWSRRGMNMTQRKGNDEISKLLDSFEEEDALEEKMQGFAEKKRRESFDSHKQYILSDDEDLSTPEIPDHGDTVVLRPTGKQENVEGNGQTVMFDPHEMEEESQETNKTVVINDNEIQSLLDEEKGPKLKRQVVSSGHSKKKKNSSSDSMDKKVKTILIILVSLLVITMAGAGIYWAVTNIFSGNQEEETKDHTDEVDQLMDWIDGLSDDYSSIVELEDVYNQLNDDEKDEINTALQAKTGYTFDELLAHETSEEKKNSSNNNTEVAQLRAQLQTLQSQLNSAQRTLDDANATLSQRQSEYDEANQALSQAQSAQSQLASAQQAYNDCVTRMQELESIPNDQITNEQLTELSGLYSKEEQLRQELSTAEGQANQYGNISSLQTAANNASAALSQAQSAVQSAQNSVNDLNTQISSVQQQIESLS